MSLWNGTLTFSILGWCWFVWKVHNKRSTLVNWSKKLVSNLTKHTLQYWNVRSTNLALEASGPPGSQLKNHGAWTNVTTVVWLVKQSRSCWTIWWWTVHIWRRSYDVLPPAMDRDALSTHWPSLCFSLDRFIVTPDAENLKVTLERALPFWEDKIAPALKDGKNVFVGSTRYPQSVPCIKTYQTIVRRRNHGCGNP